MRWGKGVNSKEHLLVDGFDKFGEEICGPATEVWIMTAQSSLIKERDLNTNSTDCPIFVEHNLNIVVCFNCFVSYFMIEGGFHSWEAIHLQ